MAQEFIVKSQNIEDKINQLLPSQGGFGAGVDISASTQVVPIIDLTETAEGSILRQDLQTSFSLSNSSVFSVNNTSSTIINTTGYFRIVGSALAVFGAATNIFAQLTLTDGFTSKIIYKFGKGNATNAGNGAASVDIMVKVEAGESVVADTNNTTVNFAGVTRQIADISGNLINP
jgi:hypothetical protein